MKKNAQLRRSSTLPVVRGGAARVQKKVRPGGAGNHHRQDSFERQAEEIAARIVRGEQGLARRISPTAAAGFHPAGSQGRPLPRAVREPMEAAFGANFDAVRIHTGAAADAAAAEYGAEALASGRDIYFRAGRYAPFSGTGKALLAHELAHVLQQTGRRDTQGNLAATDLLGTGSVQLAPNLADEFTSRSLFAEEPSLDTVIARHVAGNPGDGDIVAHATTIKETLNQTSTSPTPVEQLVAKTQATGFTTKPELLALYFDVIKRTGDFDSARKAVKYVIPGRTAFGSNDLYAKKLKGDLSWMAGTMSGSPLLAKYWKKRFVDTFRMHLFGPGRVEQNLGADRKFSEVYEEQMTAAAAPTALIDSERRSYALAALKRLDEFRVVLLQGNRQLNEKGGATEFRLEQRQWFAQVLATEGKLEEMAAVWDLPAESLHLWSLVIGDIRAVANEAVVFWDRVFGLEKARVAGGDFESFGSVLELLGETKDLKEMKNLQRDLLRVAKAAFSLPGGKTPTAAQHQAAMKAQAAALTVLATDYDAKIFELARAQAQGKPIDEKLFLLLGWVQWLLFALALGMRQFAPAKLPAGATPAEKRAAEDELVKHRLKLVGGWYGLAAALKFEDLSVFLLQVYRGEQVGQKQSQLALYGEWTLDEESGLALMSKEFPKGQMKGLEPLTGADIANFCYMLYAQDLAKAISDILNKEGMASDFSGTKEPVINQAIERVKELAHPRRYLMRDYLAAIIPAERERFGDLVEAHPKYTEFLNGTEVGTVVVVPSDLGTHQKAGALVLWTVPRLNELAALLSTSVPGLDSVVRAQMEGKLAEYDAAAAQGQEPKPIGEEWFKWLEALKAVVAADPTLAPKIHEAIIAGHGAAVTQLSQQSRLATSHQRRVLLTQELTKLWTDYSPTDIKTYTLPNKAVLRMMDFAGHVSPPQDAPLQTAALLIELGPLLFSRLGPQPVLGGLLETGGVYRFDIIAGLLPHLAGTVALAADAAKLADLKTLQLQVPLGFDVHLEAIKQLKSQTEATQLNMQLTSKLVVSKEGGSLAVAGRGYPVFAGAENAFMIDGNQYQLVEIYESFSFVPGVVMAAEGIDWPESELGDSLLTYADGTVAKKADRNGRQLFKILRNDVEVVVRDNDERLLSELTHVVTMQSFVRGMETLAKVIDIYGEVLLTGVELIPGWGQAFMVARLVTSVLAFVTSPEFDQIKEALGGDAGKVAEQAIEKIKELFTPDALWNWVLFGDPALPTLAPLGQTDKQKKLTQRHGKGSAAARLGAILARLAKVGVNLGTSVGRLHDKFEYPMRQTQVFVLSHPLIGVVLNLIAANFGRLSSLQLGELSLPSDLGKEKIKEEMGVLSTRVSELLENVQHLQLPQEIIPLEQMVGVVLELVTDHLGGKYKVAVKVLKTGLQAIGAWDTITAAVADEMKAADMDPNILWRDLIRKELEPLFEGLCADFAGAAGSTLDQVPFLKGVAQPTAPDIGFELEEGEFPEAQEWPSEHPAARPAPLPSWPRATGSPLAAPVARDAARRFGHDFSHVRLHTGSAAAGITNAVGAEGLASGSHVYLRPGLSPASGHGARVFRHELAHVVQQTGSRPLGRRYSAAPLAGEPRRGIRHDPSLEAAADRTAASAAHSPLAARPLDPGSTGVRAPQPKLDRLIQQFFTKVGADQPLLDRVKDIKDEKGAPTGLRLNAYGNRVVAELPGKLKDAITGLKLQKSTFPGYLEPVHNDVVDFLINNHWATINQAMTQLVKRAHEGKAVKVKDSSGVTKDKTEWTFRPARLEQDLEEFIFGLTGVLFDLEFTLEAAPGATGAVAAPAAKQVDLANPIKTIKPLALHLGYVGGTAGLWDQIVKNTWVTHSPTIIPPTRFKNTTDFPRQAEAIAAYKLNARLVLMDAGPQAKVFMAKEFRFSDWFAKQVEDSVFPVAGGKLDPSALPPWDDYKNPAKTTLNYSAGSGHVHLSFGTYAERTKPKEQWGVARNAHHITQYLILEYLRNSKSDQKPFRHSLKEYPGVKGSGKLVDTITKPGGTRAINVLDYETGRGGAMPTILISEHTHQNGDVHVHSKPDDSPGATSTSAPGFAVHNEFRARLGADYTAIMFDPMPTKLQAVGKQTRGEVVPAGQEVKIGATVVTSDLLQEAIFTASCKTYQWMRDDMKAKLKTALKSEEVHYYETMVRRRMEAAGNPNWATDALPVGYQPAATDMNTVSAAAETHNSSIMEDAGKVGFEGA